jgi:group II intron reverse transcriptase/maturase
MRREQKTEEDSGCPYENRVEPERGMGARSVIALESVEADSTGAVDLLEAVLHRNNLNAAYQRVKGNGGAAGVDGMSVKQLGPWLKAQKDELLAELREGKYEPKPVRRVEIPKPDGGKRALGIPTVLDRLIQQALSQVLTPIFEETFSEHSYGFRPGRSTHQAITQAKAYYEEGYTQVVDIDMAKYFDTVHHDILMDMVAEQVTDKRVLKLIRKFMKSGVLADGFVSPTDEGTPQGGPLSPLLSNIYLNRFDKELESRGHRFVRYADDCNIYVKSRRAALRVMESSKAFLEGKLRLTVNMEKSQVGSPLRLKFLGFSLYKVKDKVGVRIHPKSEQRFKARIREITKRNRGVSFVKVLLELKRFTTGWINYFGIASLTAKVKRYSEWIRRRLRQYLWKQWKRIRTRFDALKRHGIPKDKAWEWANTRKGYWRISGSFILTRSLTNECLVTMGYDDIESRYKALCSCY